MKVSVLFGIINVLALTLDISVVVYHCIKAHKKKCSLPDWLGIFTQIMSGVCWLLFATTTSLQINGM